MKTNLEQLKIDKEEILVDYWEEKYGCNYNNGEGAEDALDRWLSNLDENDVKRIYDNLLSNFGKV